MWFVKDFSEFGNLPSFPPLLLVSSVLPQARTVNSTPITNFAALVPLLGQWV